MVEFKRTKSKFGDVVYWFTGGYISIAAGDGKEYGDPIEVNSVKLRARIDYKIDGNTLEAKHETFQRTEWKGNWNKMDASDSAKRRIREEFLQIAYGLLSTDKAGRLEANALDAQQELSRCLGKVEDLQAQLAEAQAAVKEATTKATMAKLAVEKIH